MLPNLDFANKTILPSFFLFFLIINLYYLIPAVIAQIFNPIAKLIIPVRIAIKKAKAEIETRPVIDIVIDPVINIIQNSTTILCFLLNNLFSFISSIE